MAKVVKGKSLAKFVKEVMDEGWEREDHHSVDSLFTVLGFPPEASSYGIDESSDTANDNKYRLLEVVMDPSTTTARVLGLYVQATLLSGNADEFSESMVYRVAPDGTLEKAVLGRKTRGEDPKLETVEITPEVKAQFKREMDFWLKGKGRKKAQPKKAAN